MSALSDLIGTLTDREMRIERELFDVRAAIRALAALSVEKATPTEAPRDGRKVGVPSVRQIASRCLAESPGMTAKQLTTAIASAQGVDWNVAQNRASWLYSRHSKGIVERHDGKWYLVAQQETPIPALSIQGGTA